MRKLRRELFFCAALILGNANVGFAQEYPNKPVRVIAGFPAGGGGDLTARVVADLLSRKLGNQFIVVNMPGASSTIGAGHVAKAPPDGYTLLFATSPFTLSPNLYKSVPYDPIKDFAPIVRVADGPFCMVVQAASPMNSIQDLIAAARAKPGALNFASGGTASVSQFAGEVFKSMAKVDIQSVPYTGLTQALAGVMGGQVQMAIADLASAAGEVRGGRLKMLAVTSAKRVPLLPEVPTVAESGLPGYEVTLWYGLLAPAGVPKAIIDKLHGALSGVFDNPEKVLMERFSALGVTPAPKNTPEEFATFVESDLGFWKRFVAESGVSPR